MAAPPHHFMQNLNMPGQGGMRGTFGPGPIQNSLGGTGMQNTMPNQMASPMGTPIMGQINNPLNGAMSPINTQLNAAMNPALNSNSAMLSQMNQQYSMNSPISGNISGSITPMSGNQMVSHQTPPMPMQQRPIEFTPGLNHHEMTQSQTPGVTPTPPSHTPQQQQSKEFNTASLCRLGQETVQDIVSRTQEVFQTLKAIQPPSGTTQSSTASNEKKAKVQELLRTIRVLFKRLRLIYEKCNENCQIQGMEYTHIESLIPFRDELDPKHEEKKNSETYRLACEESKEVMEQVILKNKQLKEVIDHLRRIVWEINTMLTMRKS
ncbi:mediator of RNA polymerase II transcription subunit 30-like isoform X2 [Cylas formicarius]|uniref:mediator of RNA polymerase II transcription subunit 30-like isoform X2 n=1 Tax=Cylas formicarius TaxID=197179 RepID=UPI0029587CFC|nr:mediator of RNA polymerase II transcription subunit 30-like isoform X2 [Cylas formicarius]